MLSGNNISKPDDQPVMANLETIMLDYNLLIVFPVLTNISLSLIELSTEENPHIKIGDADNFPKQKLLKLGGNSLADFPRFKFDLLNIRRVSVNEQHNKSRGLCTENGEMKNARDKSQTILGISKFDKSHPFLG
jgi:hypothetical protein